MIDVITLTGNQVLYAISTFGAIILGIILFIKMLFMYGKKSWGILLLSKNNIREKRVKYPGINPFNFTKQIRGLSLFITLSVIYTLFAWTVKTPTIEEYAHDYNTEEIISPKRTKHPTKRLEKIETNFVEADPVFEPEEIEEPSLIEDVIEEYSSDETIENPFASEASIKTPEPPPLPPRQESDAPIIFAEQMPRFPGCSKPELNKMEKKKCTEEKLMAYIYSKIKYPQVAREAGISGTVYARFVVSKIGEIKNVQILRSPHSSLGDETTRVIDLMNSHIDNWEPGRQNGLPVNVLYTLPIKFKLK